MAKLVNNLSSKPDAEIQYRASGTQLAIHSNASYISVSRDRIRASCVHFLSEGPPNPKNPENFIPTVNEIKLLVYKIMRNIMVSAFEAEYGTIFINAQTAVTIHTMLS